MGGGQLPSTYAMQLPLDTMEVKVLVKVRVDTGIEVAVVMDTEVNTMVEVVTQAGRQAEAVIVRKCAVKFCRKPNLWERKNTQNC